MGDDEQMEDARIKAQKDAQGWAGVMAGNVYRHFKRDCEEYEQRRAYERRFASVDSMPQTQTVYKMIYEQKKRGGKQ